MQQFGRMGARDKLRPRVFARSIPSWKMMARNERYRILSSAYRRLAVSAVVDQPDMQAGWAPMRRAN
jgi:hypothetical protein